MSWIQIAGIDELIELTQEKGYIIFDIEDQGRSKSVILFYLDNEFHALENRCSHDNAELNLDRIVDHNTIQCPRHGAKFNIQTGEALTMPAKAAIKKFDLKKEDALLYIRMNNIEK